MNHEGKKLAEVRIASFEDIVSARQSAREIMAQMGYNLLDQTRIVTAVSELARNIMLYAKVGAMRIFESNQPGADRKGIQCVFEDQGPGMKDLGSAMKEGLCATGSLGLGLMSAKALSDDFNISSVAGKGTTVTISKWL
jgi:serine/threonine-protein kinase RsbT